MCNKARQSTGLWPLILVAFLAACGSQPRSDYPVLERSLDSDAELDCAGLEDELLKANAIRDAIHEEHGDVIAEYVLVSAADFALDPVSGLISSIVWGSAGSRAGRKYAEAATAAGLRMEQLLFYKKERSCPSGPTAKPELTDDIALSQLQDLQSKFEEKEISKRQFIEERRQLLDDLR